MYGKKNIVCYTGLTLLKEVRYKIEVLLNYILENFQLFIENSAFPI